MEILKKKNGVNMIHKKRKKEKEKKVEFKVATYLNKKI